jgi:hypothetical protein
MRIIDRLLTSTLLAIALAFGVGATHAGTADMSTSDGHKMKFEYLGDDLLRINMQEGNYMLVQGGEVYMVTDSDGELMVIKLEQAMGMFGSMADSATPSAVEGKLVSLKSLGRKETVAGIQGEVYEVRFIDHEGQERTGEVVLSADPRAVELQQAMFNMSKSMAKATNREVKGQEEIERKLDGMNMGILRYGDDMRVTAISDKTFDKRHFALPAEPTDLSGLQGMFGGGQAGGDQGQSGGMMSGFLGAFGQQGEEQDGTEGEQEEQEEGAEGGTESIKKAFGKLFGK